MDQSNWHKLQKYQPSPIQEIPHPVFLEQGLQLLVKRDDLLHWPGAPAFGGNKWRKLKYNLLAARDQGAECLLTFGGAFSNHLAATAAAAQALGFSSVGMVRGERPMQGNPTLDYCEACGMELRFISRTAYRQLTSNLNCLPGEFTGYYVLPEGGSNTLAIQGCAELVEELSEQINLGPANYIAAACGTGATVAGIAVGSKGQVRVLGIPVVGGHFMEGAISKYLADYQYSMPIHWQLENHYTFGGYARFDDALIDFINDFNSEYQIPLDPVYTGKMFCGLIDLARNGFFAGAGTIIAIHTGGLQGVAGFNQRWGNRII